MTISHSGLLFWGHPVYARKMFMSEIRKLKCGNVIIIKQNVCSG